MKKLKMDLTGLGELLSREQMKMVTGGDDYGYGSGNTVTCITSCLKYNPKTGQNDSGTCSKNSNKVGNVWINTCDCSILGGSSCYAP